MAIISHNQHTNLERVNRDNVHFAEEILACSKPRSFGNFPYPPRLLQTEWFLLRSSAGKEYSWHLHKDVQADEFCSDTTAKTHKVKLCSFSVLQQRQSTFV